MQLLLLRETLFSLMSLNSNRITQRLTFKDGLHSPAWSAEWTNPKDCLLTQLWESVLFPRCGLPCCLLLEHKNKPPLFIQSLFLVFSCAFMTPSLFISPEDKLCEIIFWHMGAENEFFTDFLGWSHLYHRKHFGCCYIWIYKFFSFYFALK